MSTLLNHDKPASDLVSVPDYIDSDITLSQVEAINQGGCASGAYMPAVTDYKARETMSEHGDTVLRFIEDTYGELPEDELRTAIEDLEEEGEYRERMPRGWAEPNEKQ